MPQYQKEYGPGNYVPNVFIQYWSMRVMAYLATLVFLFSLWGGWLLYRKTLDHAKWFLRIAPWLVILPFLINTAGWMLDRERAPALDRPGADEDRKRGLTVGLGHRHLDLHHRLRRHLLRVSASPTPGSCSATAGGTWATTPSPSSMSPGGDAGPSSTEHESSDEDESALVY